MNNTHSTLFFSEVTFMTEWSRPDVSPVFVINGAGHGMRLPLLNLGFGRLQRCVVRFRTRLRLGEPLPEAPVHASAAYDAILESSRENYEMRVPISHEVSPGKVDRFTIRVAAPAASRHRFRLRLRFNESGLVESQPIELHVFMTRYDVDLLHKGDHAPTELRHPSGRTMRRRAEP